MNRHVHRCACGLVAAPLLLRAVPAAASEPLDLYDSEATARSHCGSDAVVWLDVPAKTYWLEGQKGFDGRPHDGGFTCRHDAVSTGNHPTRR